MEHHGDHNCQRCGAKQLLYRSGILGVDKNPRWYRQRLLEIRSQPEAALGFLAHLNIFRLPPNDNQIAQEHKDDSVEVLLKQLDEDNKKTHDLLPYLTYMAILRYRKSDPDHWQFPDETRECASLLYMWLYQYKVGYSYSRELEEKKQTIEEILSLE